MLKRYVGYDINGLDGAPRSSEHGSAARCESVSGVLAANC